MLSSSTPDALWSAPSLRVLRPAAVTCSDLVHGRLLDRCTFTIPAGTRLLVVGEPDASASVLVRVLAGLTRTRRGRFSIAGLDGPSAVAAGRVAHLGSEPGMPGWMTPREALGLAADLAGMRSADAARAIDRVVAQTQIPGAALHQPIRHAGPAVAQRTGFAAAILRDPEVLLLDEPLRALDAAERAALLRVPGRRRTIVLASRHPASDAGIATHVALIREGRIAVLARVEELAASGPLSLRGISALAHRSPSSAPSAATRPVAAPR